jgi:hypothetical protein
MQVDSKNARIEVRIVRPKKRPALITPLLLLKLATHAAMGVAVGLAFALLVTHITQLGIAALISYSLNPSATFLTFVCTCATTFGIGATLTGLAITLTDDDNTADH